MTTTECGGAAASSASMVWHSRDSRTWQEALDRYWNGGFIKPALMPLEREFDSLDPGWVESRDADGWYHFLLEKYFRWKYTAPNRYVTTANRLKTYRARQQLDELHQIQSELFAFDRSDIEAGLRIASRIRGLGIAGASGLLAVLFPRFFGTVDQFLVKALQQIEDLPERRALLAIQPNSIRLRQAVILIGIMQAKADENNRLFKTDFWTPRKVDMVLWAARQPSHAVEARHQSAVMPA